MIQLLLDIYVGTRTRSGVWPLEAHQRGWVTLPREIAAHPEAGMPRPRIGDVLPAWVCCRCGGVELDRAQITTHHGCCFPDVVNHPCDRRAEWPAWSRDFDNAWTPAHPGGGEAR